jgi:hypothetical protein
MQPTITIDRQVLRDLDRTIQDTVRKTRKSMSGALIQASVFAAQGAAKDTPQAKKNRPSKRYKANRVIGNKSREKKGIPWWAMGSVEIWSRGQRETKFFRSERTFQKARPTPRRGLAKNVWKSTAAKRTRRILNNAGMVDRYAGTTIHKIGADVTGVTMTNSLRYIQKVAPNSAIAGMRSARNRMQAFLDKKLAKQIERDFQRRSR